MSGIVAFYLRVKSRSALYSAPATLGRCGGGDEEHSASSNSNLRTCGARNARSFKFSMFSRSSRRSMLARDFNARLTEHYGVTSLCVCNLILSGYRGLSCFAEHSSDRIPDHFQAPSPLSFQGRFHVLKLSAEVFGNVRKVVGEIRNV